MKKLILSAMMLCACAADPTEKYEMLSWTWEDEAKQYSVSQPCDLYRQWHYNSGRPNDDMDSAICYHNGIKTVLTGVSKFTDGDSVYLDIVTGAMPGFNSSRVQLFGQSKNGNGMEWNEIVLIIKK